VPALSEWLQLMLAEIARKREEAERARSEEAQRASEPETTRQRSEDEPS
jgi:septal ring factor EnvC (AmiA/AmiB activator)